jgi:DNA polymerase
MSAEFHQLLDATIHHLQSLKMSGAQFVSLDGNTLQMLNGAARKRNIERPTSNIEHGKNDVTPSAVASPVLTPQPSTLNGTKAAALAELRERAIQCVKCPNLVAARTNVVFGVGNIDAEIMFVGEAPGADEDLQASRSLARRANYSRG